MNRQKVKHLTVFLLILIALVLSGVSLIGSANERYERGLAGSNLLSRIYYLSIGKDRQIEQEDYADYSEEANSLEASEEDSGQTAITLPPLKIEPGDKMTVLLIGMDARAEDNSVGNTDTLIIAHADPGKDRIIFLSIPRDTQVNIPNKGIQKINAAARLGGGWRSTIAAAEGLIGYAIEGYILTNFEGFKGIIDTLGGITVDVEKNMFYETGDREDGTINLKKGVQRLDGDKALQYARFRNDELADISRTERQQVILKAIAREMAQPKTLVKLPWLIPQIVKTVETNLSINRLWSIAGMLRRQDQLQVVSQTLPGCFVTENNISYWKVRTAEAREVTRQLFEYGKTADVFVAPEAGHVVKQSAVKESPKNIQRPIPADKNNADKAIKSQGGGKKVRNRSG